MQFEQMTWEQRIKHVPLEGTTRDLLLSLFADVQKRLTDLETKPHTITEAISEKLHKHKKHDDSE